MPDDAAAAPRGTVAAVSADGASCPKSVATRRRRNVMESGAVGRPGAMAAAAGATSLNRPAGWPADSVAASPASSAAASAVEPRNAAPRRMHAAARRRRQPGNNPPDFMSTGPPPRTPTRLTPNRCHAGATAAAARLTHGAPQRPSRSWSSSTRCFMSRRVSTNGPSVGPVRSTNHSNPRVFCSMLGPPGVEGGDAGVDTCVRYHKTHKLHDTLLP